MNNGAQVIFAVGLFFVWANLVAAQDTTNLVEEKRLKYPKEKAVFLFRDKRINIDFDNKKDSFQIISTISSRMLHLRSHSQNYAQESVPFSDYTQILSIDAYSLIPNETGIQKKQVLTFRERNVVSEDVFYNDVKEKTFVFPNITVGVQTHLAYTEKLLEPRFLGSYFFTSYVPCEKSLLEVSVTEDIELGYKLMGSDTTLLTFQKNKQGNRIVYRWVMKDARKFLDEKSAPNFRFYEPHVALYIKKRKLPNGQTQVVLNSPKDLYAWYYPFIEEVNKNKFPSLEYFVDSLVAKDKTDLEKAKTIYEWVSNQIQYVAFEDGERGFRPSAPDEVCKRKYGDCKDMAALLMTLLRTANIEAYLAWIGSRDLPYRYQDLPTPLVDNHMIVVVRIDNQTYFLDATSKSEYFEEPSYFIQDKEALVAKDENSFEILTVPVTKKEKNTVYDSMRIHLDGSTVIVKGVMQLKGFAKTTMLPYLQAMEGQQEQEKELFKRIINPQKTTINLIAYSVLSVQNQMPLQIQYHYELANHTQSLYSETYLNLHLNPVWKNTEIDTLRKSPVSSNYNFEKTQVYVFELPNGVSVKHLPKNQRYDSPYFGFSVTYEKTKEYIKLRHTVYSNYLIMPRAYYGVWNQMLKELYQAYRQNIILD